MNMTLYMNNGRARFFESLNTQYNLRKNHFHTESNKNENAAVAMSNNFMQRGWRRKIHQF